MTNIFTSCGACGFPLSDEQSPCPECGCSAMRDTTVSLDTGVVNINNAAPIIKERDLGRTASGQDRYERKLWENTYRATGRMSQLCQEVDRTDPDPARWRYHKKIIDVESGEVLRDEDKLLSDHHGHGSAKRSPGGS